MPFLVLATVRDGGPGSTVLNDARFRSLREGLEHVELQPPSDALIDEVAEKVEPAPLPSGVRERSFAFMLEKEFEVQRGRYQSLVRSERENDRQALRWLKTAKLLDDRDISLERERVRDVASALFGLEPGETEAALLALKEQGFQDGQALEPAFLKSVVPDPVQEQTDLPEQLKAALQERRDSWALGAWGTRVAIQGQRPNQARRLLESAVEAGQTMNTPEGLVVAAKASYNIGVLLKGQGDAAGAQAGAQAAYEAAVADGRAAGTPEGLVQAATASYNLGVLLDDNSDEERQYYESAVADGRAAGTPEGLVQAAKASVNLGVLLEEQRDSAGARAAYEAAIEVAGAMEGEEAEEIVERAQRALALLQDRKPEP